jgi:phosphatidylinositol alpha-1,6-mannosyltransferase
MPSLLVTNDFPPKHGGIQSYLYELWRRLPPAGTTVLTTAFPGADTWDRQQEFRVERSKSRVLLPSRTLRDRIDALAREVSADVIFLDPMLPVGAVGPKLTAAPYVVVAHGAEITGYGHLPGTHQAARRVLRGAAGVVAAGRYPAREAVRAAGRPLPGVVIPPGVDVTRFAPIDAETRKQARARWGLDLELPLVLGLSRLVPRKGFDVVIDACASLRGVQLAIGGAGRDRKRLERRARGGVHFLGRVPDAELPALYGAADVFAMCCRERWGGLEAEGFGIVFLEAAACGVPAVAGRSGGSHEAVADGDTGFVVAPRDLDAVRNAVETFVGDEDLRHMMSDAARRRAVEDFAYDRLVDLLLPIAAGNFADLDSLGADHNIDDERGGA